jgi:hypothetical protein
MLADDESVMDLAVQQDAPSAIRFEKKKQDDFESCKYRKPRTQDARTMIQNRNRRKILLFNALFQRATLTQASMEACRLTGTSELLSVHG